MASNESIIRQINYPNYINAAILPIQSQIVRLFTRVGVIYKSSQCILVNIRSRKFASVKMMAAKVILLFCLFLTDIDINSRFSEGRPIPVSFYSIFIFCCYSKLSCYLDKEFSKLPDSFKPCND